MMRSPFRPWGTASPRPVVRSGGRSPLQSTAQRSKCCASEAAASPEMGSSKVPWSRPRPCPEPRRPGANPGKPANYRAHPIPQLSTPSARQRSRRALCGSPGGRAPSASLRALTGAVWSERRSNLCPPQQVGRSAASPAARDPPKVPGIWGLRRPGYSFLSLTFPPPR